MSNSQRNKEFKLKILWMRIKQINWNHLVSLRFSLFHRNTQAQKGSEKIYTIHKNGQITPSFENQTKIGKIPFSFEALSRLETLCTILLLCTKWVAKKIRLPYLFHIYNFFFDSIQARCMCHSVDRICWEYYIPYYPTAHIFISADLVGEN